MKTEIEIPDWAKKVEQYGNKRHEENRGTADFVFSIIANLLVLYLINYVIPFNNIPFFKSSIFAVVWVWNLTILASIAINAILLFIHTKPVYYFSQILQNAVGFVGTAVLLVIYPLDFVAIGMPWLDILFRIALTIALVVMAIQIIIFVTKLLVSLLGGKE